MTQCLPRALIHLASRQCDIRFLAVSPRDRFSLASTAALIDACSDLCSVAKDFSGRRNRYASWFPSIFVGVRRVPSRDLT